MGVQGGLTLQDDWVTSYRCHGVAYLRGSSVANVLGELFGFAIGTVGGKGGSMHFYGSKHGFWGGHGIVGAQVPVGNGIAFAHAYNAKEGQCVLPATRGATRPALTLTRPPRRRRRPMNVSVAACGDGAVNQGQVWESINMAALWKLPMIFMVENNMYGMGTSSARSSSNPEYYTHGNHVPGLRVDGMDVLAVREATRFAKEYCGGGHGPLVMEVRAPARARASAWRSTECSPQAHALTRPSSRPRPGAHLPLPRALHVRPGHVLPRPRGDQHDAREERLH